MATERIVGGLGCFAVLAGLSDYLDDELDAETRAQVEVHLRGCDACTKFGGEMAKVVQSVRAALLAPEIDGGISERLRERLASDDGGAG